MKWDSSGIAVCQFMTVYTFLRCMTWLGSFYRAAIPQDITQGLPDPSNWGEPVAALASTNCNISQYFANHSFVFGTSSRLVCTFQIHPISRYHVLW